MNMVETKITLPTNQELLMELVLSNSKKAMTPGLKDMFEQICEAYARNVRFNKCEYREEMKEHAMFTLERIWKHFNYTRFNKPLQYFVTCVTGAFLHVYNTHARERWLKDM